ncbi:MAG: S8 family peptidase, partial [Alphaproteobacteria bacterium]
SKNVDIAGLLADLEALGLTNGSTWGNTVSGLLPIASLEAAAGLGNLNVARGAQAISNVGAVESEASASMGADTLRTVEGVDGSGVAIGVMSDSYDNLGGEAAGITSGDLPNNVVVVRDLDSGGSDEGRAMIELVHDVAPGADLLFRTAFLGQADFANGIIALVNAGADIVTDDIFYFNEPFFQDGIIAQAANLAVQAGVPYYTSAGNSGDDSYESIFADSGQTISYTNDNGVAVIGQLHDFDPGVGVDTLQSITVPGGGATLRMGLQWDEPFSSVSAANGGAVEDYDILLTDNAGAILANLTASSSTIDGDPVEIFTISNAGSSAVQANLSIVRTNLGAQASDNFLKYVFFRSGGTT